MKSRNKNATAVYCLLSFVILIASCDKSAEFDLRLEAAIANLTGEELLNELYSMDQDYPNRIELKTIIGSMLLAKGDTEKASIFLRKGEELARFGGDNAIKARLYASLAELSLDESDYASGVAYADKSLSFDKADPGGVRFIKAKCLLYANEEDKALAAFDEGWSARKDAMNREDMNLYMTILRDRELYEKALDVSIEYGKRFDYEPGLGIIESVFYEKLGKADASIVSAAKDLEYARYTGTMDEKEELSRLTNLAKKLDDKAWNPGQGGKRALEGLISYVSGEWKKAYADLLKAGIKPGELPFFDFLLLSALLESGDATADDLARYLSLEEYFDSFPGYYYHLYRGMPASDGVPGLSYEKRTAMESCIRLARSTIYAKETRIALAELLGLGLKGGEKLVLPWELDEIYRILAEGSQPETLDPAIRFLALPDNVYTPKAVSMLKNAKELPGIGDYLEKKLKSSSGRIKELLEVVMNG